MEGMMARGDVLTLEESEVVSRYAARATWPCGFVIYQRGAPADGLFIVTRGRVVLRSRVRAGRGFIPEIATPGDVFGAEGLAPDAMYVTDARADEETETLHLSGPRFRAFIREMPQQGIALVGRVMAERNQLLDKLREVTTMSVEQRLISSLLRMAEKGTFTADDGSIVLCSTRYRLLCELVGATRESVSLVLGRLVAAGLVQRRGTTYVVTKAGPLAERLDHVSPDLGRELATTVKGESAAGLI